MSRNSCISWKSVRIDRVSTEIGHEREWAGAAGRIRSILKQLMRSTLTFAYDAQGCNLRRWASPHDNGDE